MPDWCRKGTCGTEIFPGNLKKRLEIRIHINSLAPLLSATFK
jgi:hypothetical protein